MLGSHPGGLAQDQVPGPTETLQNKWEHPGIEGWGPATWGLPSRMSLLHSSRQCYRTEYSVHGAPHHVEQPARTRRPQASWLLKLGELDQL